MLDKDEQAICAIHGAFYAGQDECPICKAQNEAIREDKEPPHATK